MIISLCQYRWLVNHYNTACHISNSYRLKGKEADSHHWFLIAQGIAIKMDAII